MAKRGIRIAKPTKEDIEEIKAYLKRLENNNARNFPIGWRRVVYAAEILVDNCCDPQEDHLDWSPYLEERHVENEQ